MRVLVAAATAPEVGPLVDAFGATGPAASGGRTRTFRYERHEIDLLVTGVGMVATAAWCSRTLSVGNFDVAFNVGVCGSFDPALPPGAVVHICADRIAELGAEDADRFLTIEELALLDREERPYARAELVNEQPPRSAALAALPQVKGITVNTVHGNTRSIAQAIERFAPQVESMEGAAFMYCCMIHGVPFAQVRAVSNLVEQRNRAAWRLADAIASLNRTMLTILEEL